MTAAARVWYAARSKAVEALGVVVVLMLAALLASGQLTLGAVWQGRPLTVLGLGAFTVVFCRALARQLVPERVHTSVPVAGVAPRLRPAFEVYREFEFGLLLMTGGYVLVAITGGPRSFLYPLIYALVSFLAVLHRSRVAAAGWLVCAVGLEWLTVHSMAPVRYAIFGYHVTFVAFFAAGNLLVLSGLVRRLRGEHSAQVHSELVRMRQDARDFRLIAAQLPRQSRVRPRDEEELRMTQGAVQAVHEQMYHTLDLLRSALRLQTCVLLWLTDDHLEIKEVATSSEYVKATPQLGSGGMLASLLRSQQPLRLRALTGKRLPPYYEGPAGTTDVCAVPVLDQGSLRGVLCADRSTGEAFEDEDEAVLTRAAGHVLRIIQQERVLAAVERGKYEQEQFYAASEALNAALTLDEVYDKSFSAMSTIASFDLAVLTSYDERERTQRVLAVRVGERPDAAREWSAVATVLRDRVLEDGTTLLAMAVKNRHHMPASAERSSGDMCVFGSEPGLKLPRAKSLLVLPLMHGERVLGTFTLVSERPGQYGPQLRDMLRVISHHVAVSLQNARMYRSMEERATTDGLTGLTNHRAFQDRFEQLHALAERTGQKFAVILTDIDHFKSVNDTYGHPVGDMVLKRVAAVLASRARKVDVVARYGGEEFVLILPDTDVEGAALHANRLREEISAQVMRSEHGNFHVTMSMGIAEFPADANERAELIERADQALYACKEQGRNRVIRWREMGR